MSQPEGYVDLPARKRDDRRSNERNNDRKVGITTS